MVIASLVVAVIGTILFHLGALSILVALLIPLLKIAFGIIILLAALLLWQRYRINCRR
jgi:hypothetical protein